MFKLFRKTYTTKRDAEIEIFFKHVNWYKLIAKTWNLYPTYSAASEKILELKRESKRIRKLWHDNPSLSLPQLLASMDLLPISRINKRKGGNAEWYFSTVEDMMIAMGIPEREHIIWSSLYTRFGIKRKYPKCVLIKDMSTCHIKRVLNSTRLTVSPKYKRYFNNELEKRK